MDRAVVLGSAERGVREFFTQVEVAGLVMPDGWFGGRPMENQHELTFVAGQPEFLLVELDGHVMLIFSGTPTVQRQVSGLAMSDGTPALVVEGFSQCVLVWVEYGGDESHAQVYDSGRVWFVSPG